MHDLSTKVPPPFRLPYIGKFGVGAKAACFHLGRAATVQSKRRGAKQVTELKLDMDKLEESQWQAAGSVNSDPDPLQVPYEGFTRVRFLTWHRMLNWPQKVSTLLRILLIIPAWQKLMKTYACQLKLP